MRASRLRGLMASACFLVSCQASTSAMAQTAFTEPRADLGQVDSYTVLNDAAHDVGNYKPFNKPLTFSLTTAADVRVDMRYSGASYRGMTTVGFASEALSLYDSAHQLIGNAGNDTQFSQRICNDLSSSSNYRCSFNRGLTLNAHLAAGQYTLEFAAMTDGFVTASQSPDLYFGVSRTDANALAAYLQQLTPPNAIPEASTSAMWLLGGLMGAAVLRRRRPR